MNSLFLVVLGLSLLMDLALGAWAGANFPHFAKTWGLGGVAPAGAAHFLGWVLGTCLVGFAAIQGIAFHWTRRDKDEGPELAIIFGCWLVLSSLATYAFVVFRGLGSDFASLGLRFLVVDGLRGAVLTVLGFLALHAPSVVRELRLPDGARQPRHREERLERPRPERRDDRPRRRDEGRESRGREDRGRLSGPREGRGRDERQRYSSGGRGSQKGDALQSGHGPQRGDAPRSGHGPQRGDGPHGGHSPQRGDAGRRREEPQRGGRPPRAGRRSLPTGGPAIAADLESRAVAEARRISPDPAERPLKVVVRGAPERIRALAPDEGRLAEVFPVVPLAVPPVGGAEAIAADDGGGRRRRRRRPRGGVGSAGPPFEEGSSSSGYDELDEPVVAEREIEERDGGDSGEGQEGVSAVRGRNRRRRRPASS